MLLTGEWIAKVDAWKQKQISVWMQRETKLIHKLLHRMVWNEKESSESIRKLLVYNFDFWDNSYYVRIKELQKNPVLANELTY